MTVASLETLALSDIRRNQILQAAGQCFARSGFHGASMQQICAEAKMSPGAVYRYFPSKEAIIEAIAEEKRLEAGACVAGLLGEGPIVERMTSVAMEYIGASRDPEGQLMVEICSESLRNTAVGRRFAELENGVRTLFREALVKARQDGEIGCDVDIEAVLTMIFGMGDGLMMRLQIEREVDVQSLRPYVRRVFHALLKGEPA